MTNTDKIAVAIGNFDGIHKGHQKLLKELVSCSEKKGFIPAIYTFKTHPVNILKGEGTLRTISEIEEQKEIFSEFGINTVLYEDFEAVKNLEAEDFVKKILVDKLHVKLVVVGENNRFGKNSSGNAELLSKLGIKYGFDVRIVKSLLIDNVVCSSSAVRNALENGDVPSANKMLGRPYKIENVVINGKMLGRTYGFPTANILIPRGKVVPQYGVYATVAYVDGKSYKAITNVGVTSFDKEKIERVETYLIDFDSDIYGKKIRIDFLRQMRKFVSFKNVCDLEEQLIKDKKNRKEIMEEEI